MRPLLVGEANPYSADPRCALLPWPERAAGHRLRVILDLTEREYLRRFDRRNLIDGERWSARRARGAAVALLVEDAIRCSIGEALVGRPAIILLGRKVAAAFGFRGAPTWSDVPANGDVPRAILLPHPSGLCREWNDPRAAPRARALLAEFLPIPAPAASAGGAGTGAWLDDLREGK